MTHTILIEFDPKDASPLEVINTLDKLMQTNLEEGKISDYNMAIPHPDEDIAVIELVAQERPVEYFNIKFPNGVIGQASTREEAQSRSYEACRIEHVFMEKQTNGLYHPTLEEYFYCEASDQWRLISKEEYNK